MFFYVEFLVDELRARVRALRSGDRGASAIEWAIIAAIAVVIATVIGTVIYNVVQQKGKDLKGCATSVNCQNLGH